MPNWLKRIIRDRDRQRSTDTRIPPGRHAGRVVFIGAVHEARPALDVLLASPVAELVLVITAPYGPRAPSGAVDLAGPARAAGIPVLVTSKINAPETVAAVRERDPDLLVVVGWTRLIGRPMLAVPRRGCIGFHASLLPDNRGRAPVNWAILRGDNLTGNTMMMLNAGTDTGDIVDQRPVSIEPEDTCGTVYERIGQVGAEMLDHHLAGLLAGTAPHYPQPPDTGNLLPKRIPEMGVIDWSRPATALHDWIRALTVPYPGAFTTFEGRRIMVWQSRPPTGENGDYHRDGEPGTVLGFGGDAVRIATGRGALTVTAMADPGAAPAPAAAWCRASGVTPGARFDPIPPELARWTLGLGPRPEERGAEDR